MGDSGEPLPSAAPGDRESDGEPAGNNIAGTQGAHARPPSTGTVVFSQHEEHFLVTR